MNQRRLAGSGRSANLWVGSGVAPLLVMMVVWLLVGCGSANDPATPAAGADRGVGIARSPEREVAESEAELTPTGGARGVAVPSRRASPAAGTPSAAPVGPTPTRPVRGTPIPTLEPRAGPSGMPVLTVDQLPREAVETLVLIGRGGPFPFARDGITFENRERLLPLQPRGYYREFTVRTPGSSTRGARRIVTGRGGELYYTDDHYDSFYWIHLE